MTTNIKELMQLRDELSNPANGSKDHLRKLALSLIEALEAKGAECHRLSDELRGATALVTLMKIDARELSRELEAKDARISDLELDRGQLFIAHRTLLNQWATISELQSRVEAADKLQDSAFRSGLQHGFSLGQIDDQKGYEQSMVAYSPASCIKVEADSLDADVSNRNQPGMVAAVHIDVGDFVKFRGQVYEVKEADFDDHDVTLWFVCGEALICAAGCQIEVVSSPEEAE